MIAVLNHAICPEYIFDGTRKIEFRGIPILLGPVPGLDTANGRVPLLFGAVELLGGSDRVDGQALKLFPKGLFFDGGKISFLNAFERFKRLADAGIEYAFYMEPEALAFLEGRSLKAIGAKGGLAIISRDGVDSDYNIVQLMPSESYALPGSLLTWSV